MNKTKLTLFSALTTTFCRLLTSRLALPLLVLTLLAACSGDDDGTAKIKTYTLRARIDTGYTRVSHDDTDDYLKCNWEVGDKVELKPTATSQVTGTYVFTVTSVKVSGEAVLTYTGILPETDYFVGRATYLPGEGDACLQETNGSTSHLKYGEVLTADIREKLLANLLGEDGEVLTFRHEQTNVYRVSFTAPDELTPGAVFSIIGAWERGDASVKLGFAAAKGEEVDVYIIFDAGKVPADGTLIYSLDTGDKLYTLARTYTTAVTFDVGKFWAENLTTSQLKLRSTPGDFGCRSKTVWNALGESELMTWDEAAAISREGYVLPTREQYEELIETTTWHKTDNYHCTSERGYIVAGKLAGYRGNYIFFPEQGNDYSADGGYYWTSDEFDEYAFVLMFGGDTGEPTVSAIYKDMTCSVRLAK